MYCGLIKLKVKNKKPLQNLDLSLTVNLRAKLKRCVSNEPYTPDPVKPVL